VVARSSDARPTVVAAAVAASRDHWDEQLGKVSNSDRGSAERTV